MQTLIIIIWCNQLNTDRQSCTHALQVTTLSLLLLSGIVMAQPEPSSQPVYTLHSSVGRLWVPAVRFEEGRARHYDEQCSGTLIRGSEKSGPSRLVISAWHCIEDYRDLSRSIVFENPEGLRQTARVLATGGGMHSDWALLRLAEPLPDAMPIAPGNRSLTSPGQHVSMAGYPRGEAGSVGRPQVHVGCGIITNSDRDPQSDCILQVGASGGGVFSTNRDATYIGVISRGDGVSRSIFVPLDRFAERIRPFL